MVSPLLSLRGVTKQLGSTEVLHGIDLELFPGERVLLCGANGSGKTTLLRIVIGLSRPQSGARVTEVRSRDVGYVSHATLLYGVLTARENLEFFARVYGERVKSDELLHAWGVGECGERRVQELSRGQQMRVSLARAFLGRPKLLVLDEPTSPLDDDGCRMLKDTISRCSSAAGPALLMASHDIERVTDVMTRIVVLASGRIMADTGAGRAAPEDECQAVLQRYREANR